MRTDPTTITSIREPLIADRQAEPRWAGEPECSPLPTHITTRRSRAWLWQVMDMEEAVAWVKRCPNPMPGSSEIEIRPVFEMADFGACPKPLHA